MLILVCFWNRHASIFKFNIMELYLNHTYIIRTLMVLVNNSNLSSGYPKAIESINRRLIIPVKANSINIKQHIKH